MAKDKDTVKELTPRQEAQRVEADARAAERKRMYELARVTPIKGAVPPARKGVDRFVVSDDCVTPDGVHHRAGEVVCLDTKKHEPSVGWCLLEDHAEAERVRKAEQAAKKES